MAGDERFDDVISRWFEETAPDRMPQRVLAATFERTRRTRQDPAWRAVLGRRQMHRFVPAFGGAAVLLLATGLALTIVSTPGFVGQPTTSPSASPTPSPALLARGEFVVSDGSDGRWAVEIDAVARGSSATGRMTVSLEGAAFTVDLQCTRTTEDGLIMIGGMTTDSTSPIAPEGRWAAIVLKRASPARADLWYERGGNPIAYAASCLAGLDEQLAKERGDHPDGDPLSPIDGTVEFGPTPPEAEPSPAADLPVGPHVMVSTVGLNEDRVTVTIPASGWFAEPDEASVTKDLGGDDRVTIVTVPGDHYRVPENICNWQAGSASDPHTFDPQYRSASTVDELVSYLSEQTFDSHEHPEGTLPRDSRPRWT